MLFTQQHYMGGMHRCGWFIGQALLKGIASRKRWHQLQQDLFDRPAELTQIS